MTFNRKTLNDLAPCAAVVVLLAILEGPLALGCLVARECAKHQPKAVDPKTKAYVEASDAVSCRLIP